jgi:cytochrome P450
MTPLLDPAPDPALYAPGNRATTEATAYVGRLLLNVTAGDGSIAGTLLESTASRQGLSAEEASSALLFLLLAGQETTTNLIGNSVHMLLTKGGILDPLLAEDEAHAGGVVEEVLRLVSPVQILARIATADKAVGGHRVRRGDGLVIVLGAANVDPREYLEPLESRAGRRLAHLSFGHGPHYCLGAPLARMEGLLALMALARAFPNLRIETSPEYRPFITFRGLQRLLVSPGPAAPSPVPTPAEGAGAGGRPGGDGPLR